MNSNAVNHWSKVWRFVGADDADERYRAITGYVREHGPVQITERSELVALANIIGTRPDWHEPDEQNLSAVVNGTSFDNAGFWPLETGREDSTEIYVSLVWDHTVIAHVNLATLFAWATAD